MNFEVVVVGMKLVDFKGDDGREVKGLNIYYYGPDDMVTGFIADRRYVDANSPLYGKLVNLDYSSPFAADFLFSLTNARGRMQLVDIIPVKK